MTDVKSIINGVLCFIFGIIFMVVTWYIVPNIIEIVEIDTTIKLIFYAGLIMMYILAILVAPAVMIFKGAKQS